MTTPAQGRISQSLITAAAVLLAACGGTVQDPEGRSPGDGDPGLVGALLLSPTDAVLEVGAGASPTQAFRATLGDADVSDQATFSVTVPALGSFAGAVFAPSAIAAGTVEIQASYKGRTGSARLTINRSVVVVASSAPSDAPARFAGATLVERSAVPTIVYPADGVLMPPNLNELELQWKAAAGTDLFEISVTLPNLKVLVYTACDKTGSGCAYLPDESLWTLISRAGRGRTADLQMRGLSSSGEIGESAVRKLSFTEEDLEGGLYYWAAATGAVNRYDFGRRGQKAEAFYTPQASGSQCVGCHALSHDGSRIAVGLNSPTPSTLQILDVGSRSLLWQASSGPSSGSNFEALSPDGARVVTSRGGELELRDATAGTMLASALAGGTMPDFAPDGARVAYVTDAMGNSGYFTSQGSIQLVEIGLGGFGAIRTLVTGEGNNYYPAFSPDGAWIAFNRAPGSSYDNPAARVLVVPAAGGDPISLDEVNALPGNSWPKFAPFVHHFQGKTIFWLTFSTRRDYGVRMEQNHTAQVWMVAVSPERLAQPGLAGYPAFRLPFQDATTGNHIAQWTEKVVRQGCTPGPEGNGCGQGEQCDNGVCVPDDLIK